MDRHIADSDKIDKYFDGKLSGRELDEFEDHIYNCNDCFQQLRTREEMAHLIKKEGHILFAADLARLRAKERPSHLQQDGWLPRFVLDWPKPWIYGTAAAGAMVIILFLLNQVGLFDKRQRKQPFAVEIDSVIYGQKDSLKLEFEIHAEYERLITDLSRSNLINVISPKLGEIFETDNILFQWEIKERAPRYLKIFNNRGDEVFNVQPEKDRYVLTQKLQPGLYYWKLEGGDTLLYTGRFLVKKIHPIR